MKTMKQTNETPLKDKGSGCAATGTDLSRFMHKSLPKEEYETLRAHIEGCAFCQSALDELRDVTLAEEVAVFSVTPDPSDVIPLSSKLEALAVQKQNEWLVKSLKKSVTQFLARTKEECMKALDALVPMIPEFTPALQGAASGAVSGAQLRAILENQTKRGVSLRSVTTSPVPLDILNFSGLILDEEKLRAMYKKSLWVIAGFSPEYTNCEGYMLVLPVSRIKELNPSWNKETSQTELRRIFENPKFDPQQLEPMIAVPGEFLVRENVSLFRVVVEEELSQLVCNIDSITPALLILSNN